MSQKISKAQTAHLEEYLDQFLTKTGASSVANYFKTEDAMSYEAVCSMLDIDPLPSPEELQAQKAAEAFSAMTAREHRRVAIHDLMCPNDGAVVPLIGTKKTTTADKVASLQEARQRVEGVLAHLDAAITTYEESVKQ